MHTHTHTHIICLFGVWYFHVDDLDDDYDIQQNLANDNLKIYGDEYDDESIPVDADADGLDSSSPLKTESAYRTRSSMDHQLDDIKSNNNKASLNKASSLGGSPPNPNKPTQSSMFSHGCTHIVHCPYFPMVIWFIYFLILFYFFIFTSFFLNFLNIRSVLV